MGHDVLISTEAKRALPKRLLPKRARVGPALSVGPVPSPEATALEDPRPPILLGTLTKPPLPSPAVADG